MIRSVSFNLFPLLVIIAFQHLAVNAFVSRRAKCSIECYTKCANSGTPIAVYCNCPLSIKNDLCNSVTEQLLTDKTVERLIESDSGYKDIRTIWLKVAPVPGAFIYIFEFSIQQSFDRPIWTFAGASSSPQITFAVPDACRDYQFRTIVVIRSTDTAQQLTVFRPKSIPPQLPPFTVPKESIQLDQPKQSKDKRMVHLSVSWQNPFGYDDVDVYGYSPPTAYPIRCQTPDDQIASPRLELVQGGAKMHLTIPADALRGKCRIYMEVRMLPRCVRIEPFDVQISVELDCQKFPDLHFCQKENGPKCTDVVDLWGKDNGEVIVVWQRPAAGARLPTKNPPLFYTVHWGPVQSPQDFPSTVSRRIVRNVEQRVPGNQTKLELSGVRPGIQYGLQICAFFSEVPVPPEESPFRTEPVIPFTCTPCTHPPLLNAGGGNVSKSCIDCSKIEQAKEPTTQMPSASAPRHSVQFISADTAVLDVFGANVLAGEGNAVTTTAPERGEGWGRVDTANGKSIQTTTAQIIQTTMAPERGEGWGRVDTANGKSIQTTTAQIIQTTMAPERGEGWGRVDTANGKSIQTTTAQIIQTTMAPERGEGWGRVDTANGKSIQTTTAQIIQTTTAPERGEGWGRVDTANGKSIQTTTAQIIQTTMAPERGEGWGRVDTANGKSIQTTTAQIIQTTMAPERGEGWGRVDTANGKSIQTTTAQIIQTTTAPERGEGWNRVDTANGQIIRQSHSKTHKTEVPLELSKVEKAAKKEELTTMEVTTKVKDVSETPEVGKKPETEGNAMSGRRTSEGVRTANTVKTKTGMMPNKSEENMTNEGRVSTSTMMNTRTTTMKMGKTEEKKRTKADAEQRRGDEKRRASEEVERALKEEDEWIKTEEKKRTKADAEQRRGDEKRRASEEGERALKEEDEWIKTEEKKAEDGGMGKKKTKGWRTNSDKERGATATDIRATMTASTVTSTTKMKARETPAGSGSTTTETLTEGKRNETEGKESRNGPNSVQKEQHNHLQQQTRSRIKNEGEEGDQQQHKPERNAGAFGQFDRRKWMFAAPALFLFGLFVGLAFLLLLVVRRRKTRHRQNSILISNSQPNSRKYGRQKMRFPTGRSMPSVNGTSPSCSPSCSPSSAASSVSTVESRLGTGTSAAVQQLRGERERTLPSVTADCGGTPLPSGVNYCGGTPLPSGVNYCGGTPLPSGANYFTDNTARDNADLIKTEIGQAFGPGTVERERNTVQRKRRRTSRLLVPTAWGLLPYRYRLQNTENLGPELYDSASSSSSRKWPLFCSLVSAFFRFLAPPAKKAKGTKNICGKWMRMLAFGGGGGREESGRRRRKIGVVDEGMHVEDACREPERGKEDGDVQQMKHSGRDEKEEEDELEHLRTEGAGGKRVVLSKEKNGKESFGEQKEATREEQRAEEMQLMASRKLSKSTSDLPNADLLMEYQRRRGGAREEEAAAAATSDGEEHRHRMGAAGTKGRKKLFLALFSAVLISFKICKFVASSEVLVWNRNSPHRQVNIRPLEKVLPLRMPLINDFVGGVGGSRFKITPVENRYKRGRWEVWDYYEDGAKRGNARRGEQMPPPPSFSPPAHLLLPQSPSATAPAGQTPSASHCHPPPMPRRNSFQLVTIRNIAIADEQRRNPSEPISASQERLNKLSSDDVAKALICCPSPSLCASAVPLSSPPSHLHPPHVQLLPQLQPLHAQLPAISDSSRATTPRIVEPENGEGEMRIDRRHSNGGRGSTNSDATQHSFVMLLNQFGLEKSLTIGVENVLMCPVSSDNEKLQLNGLPITFCLASPAPSPPQTMSASFGPGQMQFDQQKGRKMSGERRTAVARRSSSASTGAVPAAQKGDGVVAIDSKIEQAMDLVKAHLIYAVRDEMELLRARIVHLEATVVQLETENAILRQHIPREVLDRLSQQQKTSHLQHNASVAAIAQ
uniref:Fibronectin type-III domain-containing protein n=1 Tax=Globodera rostochiensis TaxID=31243 RepID=A0A914H5F7_GLORO